MEPTWHQWLKSDPAEWPLRRLFWSRRLPENVDWNDIQQVSWIITRILSEGTPSDWMRIRWSAIQPIWKQITLAPHIRVFWDEFWKEGMLVGNHDAVLTAAHHQILHIAGRVLPRYGFELAGGTALAAAYCGHRQSEDLDFFTKLGRKAPAFTPGDISPLAR